MALAYAARALDDFASWACAGLAVVNKASWADCADTVDEESVGKRGAGSADVGAVEGESLLAGAFSSHKDLVDSAGRAGRSSVVGGRRAGGTDLAGSVDSSKSGNAAAGLGGAVVDLIGAAFPSADAPLVGEEAIEALAVLGGGVVVGVDWAGHAVSVGNEVIVRAGLAGAREQAESWVALA